MTVKRKLIRRVVHGLEEDVSYVSVIEARMCIRLCPGFYIFFWNQLLSTYVTFLQKRCTIHRHISAQENELYSHARWRHS